MKPIANTHARILPAHGVHKVLLPEGDSVGQNVELQLWLAPEVASSRYQTVHTLSRRRIEPSAESIEHRTNSRRRE